MTIYTTYGPVRGCSGVKHRTREAAERAIEQDARGCSRQGGYSDRQVAVVIDGRIYHDEDGQSPVWPSHGRSTGAAYF
jgi:hypothetical protein